MADNCKTMPQILCKHTEEIRPFEFDIEGDLGSAETITGVTITDDSSTDLTLTFPSFSGAKAQVTIASGTPGKMWTVKLVATTSAANTVVWLGRLEIAA